MFDKFFGPRGTLAGKQLRECMGIEPPAPISKNSTNPAPSGAEPGALNREKPVIDPDLTALINAWPALPEPIRAGILAMIRAAGG
jgi:hypothetical protein